MNVSVCVLTRIPNLLKELVKKLPQLNFIQCSGENVEKLRSSDIIIADFDMLAPILQDISHVKWVQGTWAGVDALRAALQQHGPPNFPIVRYSGHHFGRIISEYVIASIVNQEREIHAVYDNQKKSEWVKEGKICEYRIISDLNIGVMGVGKIGSKLGNFLKSFGATVFAYGRRNKLEGEEFGYVSEYFDNSQLSTFLGKCDYIVNTLPNTLETTGLLDGNILENCKEKNVIFINVGRGSVVSDVDMVKALDNKWLAGAYLDVFNEEPLPSNHPFWLFPQVKITPHVAAMSRGKDIAEQFADNFKLYLEKKPFPALLDFKKGY